MAQAKEKRIEAHKKFMEDKATAYLKPLMIDILKTKPDDVLEFIAQWCQTNGLEIKLKLAKQINHNQVQNGMADSHVRKSDEIENDNDLPSSDEDEGDLEDDEARLAKMNKKKDNNKKKMGISAEAYGSYNKIKDFEAPVIEKTDEQVSQIRKTLGMSFMFRNLDPKDFETVINAMSIKTFNDGEFVITQGNDGAELFIVGEGTLKCEKLFTGNDKPTYLKTYQVGEVFGELSLMYNAPRAASIISIGASVCFSLDRNTFNFIVKGAAMKRRNMFEEFLAKIEILAELDQYEKSKICDCLVTENYKKGDYIIREGDEGNKFYLLQEGTADALKLIDGKEAKVFEYGPNSYFGELALLNNEKRKASIKVTSEDLVVASLDKNSFKRMFGPIENILQRNVDKYAKYAAHIN